ncbi:MAG: undecaprenyl-phosphate glucose phosphotransferase [Xanthobacteraceae bacterium]|nr:undecaprenyl-phosphate glucose phosphotransferase [Xanthobacteraceae bacterium]
MNIQQGHSLVSRADTGGLLALSRGLISATVFAADVAAIVVTSCAIGIAYHLAMHDSLGPIDAFLKVGTAAASVFAIASLVRGDYAAPNLIAARPQAARILQLWSLTFVALLILGFVTKSIEIYSRGSMLLFYACTFPVLIVSRLAVVQLAMLASHSGLLCLRRVFLFGTAAGIRAFVEHYDAHTSGMLLTGCRFVSPLRRDAPPQEWQESLQADLDAAIEGARRLAPDAVVLMLPWSASEAVDICVDRFMVLPAEIHLGPERILQQFQDARLSRLGDFVSLQLTRVPLSRLELALKRAFDALAASLALVALTPLMIAIAALIKLDSAGPVFFLQRRYGFNQQPFRIVKFRTMHTLEDGEVVPQAGREDPRITRVGRWLRRWNLDEIPQLFNVIIGDMSLVGPRPHALSHDHDYGRRIARYARRHKVKPGITGWAQVNGLRGETDTQEKMEQRIKYDLHYIENWSLLLDLKILLWTVISPAAYRNAG